MNIGSAALNNKVFLAPMAGVTDLPFRLIAKEMGCGLVYSEMVSDKGLLYENCHTMDLVKIDDRERPVAVQIFGSDPVGMAKAALMVEQSGADIIDINMGCPTPKIVKNGGGSALMRTPQLAYEIMQAVVGSVHIPVTVKLRKGWDDDAVNAVQMAKLAESAGISAVAIHGRTREQYYSGKADWNIIKAVKNNVSIPVIGNGDIRIPQDAEEMIRMTCCDAVMIGRAAQGNPWLLRQTVEYLLTGKIPSLPTQKGKIKLLLRHLDMLLEYKGEYIGIREMRRHASWYTKGMHYAAEMRAEFNQAQTKHDFINIIEKFNINV